MLNIEEKKQINIIRIIWASMLGTLAVYVLIACMFGGQIKADIGPDIPVGLIKNILILVSAVEIVAAGFIRRFILTIRKPADASRIAKRYVAAVIVSLAMSESVGIYGLILFLIGEGFPTLYTFIALSAGAMIFYRPKTDEFEQFVAVEQ
jgi:hypothetical protein